MPHYRTFDKIKTSSGETIHFASLAALKAQGVGDVDRLPYSIKVLLESCVRNHDGRVVTDEHVEALAGYNAKDVGEQEIAEILNGLGPLARHMVNAHEDVPREPLGNIRLQ